MLKNVVNKAIANGSPVFVEIASQHVIDERAARERGKQAYEADCKARPVYHDGTIRKAWDALDPVIQWSWWKPCL